MNGRYKMLQEGMWGMIREVVHGATGSERSSGFTEGTGCRCVNTASPWQPSGRMNGRSVTSVVGGRGGGD